MDNVNLALLWLAITHILLFLAYTSYMVHSYQKYKFSGGYWILLIVSLLAPSLMLLIIPYLEYRSARRETPDKALLEKERRNLINGCLFFGFYCTLFILFNISLQGSSSNTTWSSEIAYVHANLVMLTYVLFNLINGFVNNRKHR